MRQLILGLVLLALNAQAQQKAATLEDVRAVMSRGALVCSVAKANLKVGGIVLEDGAPAIKFSYIDGATFKHKFIGKTTAPNGQITIHGKLVFLSHNDKAKSWFALSEEIQDKEYYQAFKFFPKYRADKSFAVDPKTGGPAEGRINIRCTNVRDIAALLPELTEAELSKLRAENTPAMN
jgi:hypothetical protein